MSCHVGCQNQYDHVLTVYDWIILLQYCSPPTYSSNFFKFLLGQICKNIAFRSAENLERDSAVVVFQRRHVIVPGLQRCDCSVTQCNSLPDGQLSPGVDLVGVVVARVVQVVTDAGRQEDADISLTERLLEPAAVYEDVHHLGNTEGVPEVVERIVPIVLLDSQQEPEHNQLTSSSTNNTQHTMIRFSSSRQCSKSLH